MNRNENQTIIKALNMYGRVPETWELVEEIERLNNIIKRLNNEISGAYTNLSNNKNVNYMHEAFQKDLLNIIKDSDKK